MKVIEIIKEMLENIVCITGRERYQDYKDAVDELEEAINEIEKKDGK